ncbi:MAG: nucleoside-diphosphate kinase [Gammaproteobacteria bacterium]|jgi:nucleoside-diphosphate kinase|nr:nucleoside-diphosphate kinase [Gammaproteobacteria bacterium]MBT7602928.1 nucleoside-diphosphate kinase [Gammaproteobacteria bacterium]
MSVEKTLSIIKPDAVGDNNVGKILQRFEDKNLEIVASKMIRLSKEKAEGFYSIHKDKPFFNSLVKFMTSGPVVVQVLKGDNAIMKNREIMGATNPAEANEGTIRKDFAKSIDENAVHGSDALETAKIEIEYFFENDEICERTK